MLAGTDKNRGTQACVTEDPWNSKPRRTTNRRNTGTGTGTSTVILKSIYAGFDSSRLPACENQETQLGYGIIEGPLLSVWFTFVFSCSMPRRSYCGESQFQIRRGGAFSTFTILREQQQTEIHCLQRNE